MTFEEAKQQAIERSEWVLCHGACYYTAGNRTAGTSSERAKTGFSSAGNIGGLLYGCTRRPNQSRCILVWNETA